MLEMKFTPQQNLIRWSSSYGGPRAYDTGEIRKQANCGVREYSTRQPNVFQIVFLHGSQR